MKDLDYENEMVKIENEAAKLAFHWDQWHLLKSSVNYVIFRFIRNTNRHLVWRKLVWPSYSKKINVISELAKIALLTYICNLVYFCSAEIYVDCV